MRWVALGVDYEMAGKDLIESVKLSGEICRALGGAPPEGFNYELFLDENGQKISKSKGNGLTIDEWLRYASPESLSCFMYREPKAAKRLYFDVIPRTVDEYQQFLDGYQRQDGRQRLSNPVWHIHSGNPPKIEMPVTFSMLLTLVSSSNAENAETLWGFIGRYRPGVTAQTHPKLNAQVEYAIHYFRDFVQPAKKFRQPNEVERKALTDLRDALSNLPPEASAEEIQDVVYEVGRREPFLDQKKKAKDGKPGVSLDWFNMLYQVLLGQEKGPRFGSFVAVYGLQNTVDMIDGALARLAHSSDRAWRRRRYRPWPPGSARAAAASRRLRCTAASSANRNSDSSRAVARQQLVRIDRRVHLDRGGPSCAGMVLSAISAMKAGVVFCRPPSVAPTTGARLPAAICDGRSAPPSESSCRRSGVRSDDGNGIAAACSCPCPA